MRLLEAILDVNQRRVAGARDLVLPVADFAPALPLAALTCIDARLNRLLPASLGIPEEHFVWSRNAGNVITGPLSSTMRSLALACAVKGAKEIALIGHSDCQVCKTTSLLLLERLAALGVDRHKLPGNLVEYFGMSGSERQNVIRGVDFIRASPLIGPKVPVHGLLIDIQTGQLEWVVNGYEAPAPLPGKVGAAFQQAEHALERFEKIGSFASEELKLPDAKIGALVSSAHDWLHKAEALAAAIGSPSAPSAAPLPAAPASDAQTARQRADEQRYRDRIAHAARPSRSR